MVDSSIPRGGIRPLAFPAQFGEGVTETEAELGGALWGAVSESSGMGSQAKFVAVSAARESVLMWGRGQVAFFCRSVSALRVFAGGALRAAEEDEENQNGHDRHAHPHGLLPSDDECLVGGSEDLVGVCSGVLADGVGDALARGSREFWWYAGESSCDGVLIPSDEQAPEERDAERRAELTREIVQR